MQSGPRFAAPTTPFDLNYVLRHAKVQYSAYLQATGGEYKDSPLTLQSAELAANEVVDHDRVSITSTHNDLLVFLNRELSKKVKCIHGDKEISMKKSDLDAAKLTTKDAGEILYELKEALQAEQVNRMAPASPSLKK